MMTQDLRELYRNENARRIRELQLARSTLNSARAAMARHGLLSLRDIDAAIGKVNERLEREVRIAVNLPQEDSAAFERATITTTEKQS
jgi:hypothetical protein